MPRVGSEQRPSHLLLNVAPVRFPDEEILVGVSEYRGSDELQHARREHWRTHVFRRKGDTLVCAPVVRDAEPFGDSVPVRLSDDLPLCAALIRNALLNGLYRRGDKSRGYEPIQYISREADDDLLAGCLPSGLSCPPWLSVRLLHELAVRLFVPDGRKHFVGVVLDYQAASLIDAACDRLIDYGVDITGLYVCGREASEDPRMAARYRVRGRVRDIESGWLHLEDVRNGDEERVEAAAVYLEARHDAVDRCLAHAFGRHAEEVREAMRLSQHRIAGGPAKLERIRKRAERLMDPRARFEMVPGIRFSIEPLIGEKRWFPAIHRAERPVYVFDPTGARTAQQSDEGLTRYGPYSGYGNLFTPNTPHVVVICQKSKKGRVDQFLARFRDGIPNSRFATGFVGKYKLSGVRFEFYTTDDDSAAAYERAVQSAIRANADADRRIHLGFVQIDAAFRALHGDRNPYLVTKAAFLAHQIPVQEFTIEKATQPVGYLAHILNTMGLAVYAKLGGTPWLLPSSRGIAHELVIGLGSAHVHEGRFGEKRRYVGITTVFTGDGNYRLANLSEAAPFDRYPAALLEALRHTVERVRADNNWQPGDTVRLVFHAFKPMKNVEVDAVAELMGELGDYEVEFAFLHLAQEHPYLLFDTGQEGVTARETGVLKGELAPKRGLYLRLTERETLMTLVGAWEVKKPEDGMPRPLLLKLHPCSNFTDDVYLARQVYLFSCHSWRNFAPAGLPVTIHYSQMIARLLGDLETVSTWSPNVMYGRIGGTRWFL